jgi:AcrR family transcriptional regulator
MTSKSTTIVDKQGEGLRARKRRLTRSAIMNNARSLFEVHGVDKTSMEAIANAADVSIASLYNYFPSKDLLLSELIIDGVEDLIAEASDIFGQKYADPVEGYMVLMRVYLAWFDGVERSWLRRMLAHATAQVDLVSTRYLHIATSLRLEVFRMTGALVAQNLLPQQLDHEMLSRLVWSIANSEFYAYVGSDKANAASFCEAFGDQLDFALTALAAPHAVR